MWPLLYVEEGEEVESCDDGTCVRESLWSAGDVQAEAQIHATRFAIVHERAEPWRTPQSYCARQVPKGVDMLIVRSERDSAIHSIYPWAGNPMREKGRS